MLFLVRFGVTRWEGVKGHRVCLLTYSGYEQSIEFVMYPC
jgi:hypothetical protein